MQADESPPPPAFLGDHRDMKTTLVALLLLVPALAHADDDRKGFVGADFELLPSGTFDGSFLGFSGSQSLDTAYGVGLFFDDSIDKYVTVGFAPRFLFNVITKNSNGDASTQLDLRARVTAGPTIAPHLRVYALAEPGYSIIFPPKDSNGNSVHPNGFVINAGGGLAYALSPSLHGYFEVAYQWGFQTYSYESNGFSTSGDFNTSYLQLGFGLAATID